MEFLGIKKESNLLIRFLTAVLIVSFFAFSDYSNFVYPIKVIAVIGLLLKTGSIRLNGHLQWILVFFAFSALSFFWAGNRDSVLFYLAWFLQAALIAYAIGNSIRNEKDFDFVLKAMLAGGLILSIRVIGSTSPADLGTFRLGTNMGFNSNEMALKLAICSIVSLYFFREQTNKWKKLFFVCTAALAIITVLFSESRKGILMVIAGSFLYLLLSSKNARKLLRNTVIVILCLFVIYELMTRIEFLYQAFGHRFLLLFDIFEEDAYVGNSIVNRQNAVALGISAFWEKPFFGYGFGNFQRATGLHYYAHNNFVELLVDLGLIGFSIYYCFYVNVFVRLINAMKKKKKKAALFLSMLCVIVVIEYGLVSFNSDYVQMVIMLGYYASILKTDNNESDCLLPDPIGAGSLSGSGIVNAKMKKTETHQRG